MQCSPGCGTSASFTRGMEEPVKAIANVTALGSGEAKAANLLRPVLVLIVVSLDGTR